MTSDDRARFDAALRQARVAAYAPERYVEQESFMRSGEILDLARRAGVGGVSLLDLCCGVAGPGRHIARELGCRYLGVDANAGAVAIARTRAADLPCRFEVAHVPPIPQGRSTWCCCSRPCSRFPTSVRCSTPSPAASRRAVGSPSPSRRGAP